MTARNAARSALRAATARDHDGVDEAFGHFTLNDHAHYTAFLRAQADIFLPVEAGLERIDLTRVLPDWQDRRRSPALTADLRDLGETVPAGVAALPYDTVEAALGAIYVLEGSRLGGRMLARSVPDTLPRRFLGAGDPTLWGKLIAVLDVNLPSPAQMAVAIDAARAVFARFEASARRHRPTSGFHRPS